MTGRVGRRTISVGWMSLSGKMKAIYEGTSLEGQFQKVGLEVAL